MKKVRFNCMMDEKTRRRLHDMASLAGRSDSNMVEYLINCSYLQAGKKGMEHKKTTGLQEVE